MSDLPAAKSLDVLNGGARRLFANLSSKATPGSELTFAFWMNGQFDGASLKPVAGRWFFPSQLSWLISHDNPGFLEWRWSTDGSNQFTAISPSTIIAAGGIENAWQHLVIAVDGTNAEFYLNGSSMGAAALTGSTPYTLTTSDLNIGADGNLSLFHLGYIAHCGLFDEKKDASWVTENWDCFLDSSDPSAVAIYQWLDFTDETPNGEDLTAVNLARLSGFPPIASGGIGTATLQNVTPTKETIILPSTEVTFDAVDNNPISIVTGWVKYVGDPRPRLFMLHDEFVQGFRLNSSMVDTNGDQTLLQFTLLPDGGWEAPIEDLGVAGFNIPCL